MSKSFAFKVFALIVIIMMLVSCAPAATATQSPAAATPVVSAPTKAPAAAGCDANKQYKVALVIGQLGDKSFLDAAARGIKMVNDTLKNVTTKIIENNDVGEQQLAARSMAGQGYDLVITVGYGSADWTTQIAQEYPKVWFAIVDSTLNDKDGKPIANGTGLTFREDEGSFTVGMIAGLLSKTGKVGYIGGVDVPLLRRFELGYIQGVKYVNPKATVTSGWVGAFDNPNKGKELALTQYTEGADIIYAAAGKSGEGVLQASKEQNKYSIGVDSDQDYMQPGSVITSMLKRVDLAVLGEVQDLVNCKLANGTKVFGLKEGGVGSTFLYNDAATFLTSGKADMVKTLKETAIPAVKKAVEEVKSGKMCVQDFMKVFPCTNPAAEGGYKP
jgi:basic membrane protein A and related proteins